MATSTENQVNGTSEESLVYALQVANSLVLPVSMHAAVQLNVFDIIAKAGPGAKLSSEEIVARLPTKNPEAPSMLDRILRALASHGIVGCSVADDEKDDPQRLLYSLTPVSKFFVPNEDGVSLGPLMTLIQDKIFIDCWSQLKDAILEGGVPFERVHGMNSFEYPGTDPRFTQVYNTALVNHTTLVLRKIIDSYNGFEQIGCLVDVGGGLGIALSLITSKYPSMKGINFDLPHIIQHAPAYPGVEHVGGDMFESVPKGDAIFIKWIFPGFSNDHCVKLLKNCYNAIPKNGKVIVVEGVVPVIPKADAYSRAATQWDVVMLMKNPGGRERTKREFESLTSKAGFGGIRFECFVCNLWVMEIFK